VELNENHQETPTTVREVGLHISYLRADISRLEKALVDYAALAATKADLVDVEHRVKKLEEANELRDDRENTVYRRITIFVASALVMMLLGLYGLDKYIAL